ncbi:hypothetical protein GCM10027084_02250 [Pseudoxanthomonas sangjuensis]|uniref:hypothetical protein n=1 Tax=Pseudoxanthomonas sangjuensis TaxID=1503750 RepID=UPI0013914C20|nr:hypothetical protein [Pseudoxanthomonas sangjuensis]KAF1713890.1 hypothetical protein CSC71_05800 [Pseudoxanthomonas sangjuensis]
MPNPFDQFDSARPMPQATGNPFDQFDAPRADFSDVTARIDSTEQRVAPSANNSDFARMVTGQPKQKPGWRRDLELGTRNVLQGAGGLIGTFGGDAFNHYVSNPLARVLGMPEEQALPYREEAARLADRMGLERPQTKRERIYGDIGEALTGTALTMGVGSGLSLLGNAGKVGPAAQGVGNMLASRPGLQAVSTIGGAGASSITRENGGSEGAQIAAGLAGSLLPGAARTTAAMTTRGLLRGSSGQTVQNNLVGFRAAGTTPTVGQATENRLARGIEAVLSKAPGGAGTMARKSASQNEQIGGAVDDLAGTLAYRSDPTKAGRAIAQGVSGPGGFLDNFRTTSARLYGELDQYLPPNTPMPATNASRYLAQQTQKIPGATATSALLSNPKLSAIRDALEADLAAGNGSIPYEAMKRVRSQVGELIADAGLAPDIPVRQLRGLYGELSKDMAAAAQATGNPKAVSAFNRANLHFRAGMNRMELIESVVGRNGGPEAVFNAAVSGTREGATKLHAVMQSLPSDAQKMLSATMLRRLGRAVSSQQDDLGAQFSTQTFLTNWDKLSPAAKSALFDRYGNGFRSNLDKIARVASNLREGAQTLPNPSGTAPAAAQLVSSGAFALAVLTQQWGYAGAIAAGVGSAWSGSRLMTNPKFVGWLARSTDVPAAMLPNMLTGLRIMAREEQDPEIDAFADDLEARMRPQQAMPVRESIPAR